MYKYRKLTLIFLMLLSTLPVALNWRPINLVWDEFTLPLHALQFARLFGMLGALILWWQYVLGFRGVAGRLVRDLIWVNRIHQLFGIYGFLLIALHPVLIGVSYGDQFLNRIMPNFDTPFYQYVFLGQVAFVMLTLTWLASALLRSRLGFRTWKRLHLFNYLILPLVLLHSYNVGADITRPGDLRTYWQFLMLTIGLLLVYRLAYQFGFGKYRYRLISKDTVTHDVIRYTFEPLGKQIKPRTGQFIYLQPLVWSEIHPFTASHFDPVTGNISISPKAAGTFTKSLPSLEIGTEVFLDGPFGVFTSEMASSRRPIVLIVGGIGITPFLRILDQLQRGKVIRSVYLFYGNKTIADIAYKKEIEEIAQKKPKQFNLVHVLSDQKDYAGETGYITGEVIKKYLHGSLAEYDFWICGPPLMMKKITQSLTEMGARREQIYSEKFSL